MRNKSLLPILLLTVFALGACTSNNGGESKQSEQESAQTSEDTTQYGVSIVNKDAFEGEWYVGDSRDLDVTLTPATNPLLELGKNLTVTSSNPEVVAVTGLGLSAVGAGQATITVKFHEATDTLDVTTLASDPRIRYGTDHEGTEADPFTNEDAVKVAVAAGNTATSKKYFVKGIVDSFRDAPGNSYGNVSFYFTPAQANGQKFLVYRAFKGESGEHITEDDIWIGGEATVFCNMYNYNGNTPENSAGWLVSCTGEKQTIENHQVNVAEAIEACKALGANGTSDGKDTYEVTGYIVAVDGSTFFMSDTKGAATYNKDNHFEVYNYGGENKAECTVNAKVKVSCTLKYYVSSKDATNYAYETSAIDSVTILEAGDEPALEVTGAPALDTITAGTYKLGLLQKNVNQNCFFKGTVNSSKYAEVSQNWADAADVVVEGDATAGFKMKVGDKYLNPKVDGTSVKVALEDTGITYAWNAVGKTLTTNVVVGSSAAEPYYLGTYNNNTTLSFSKLSYLVGSDGKLKAGTNYAANFYAPAECNADPTAIQLDQKASAIVGVPYTMALRINPYNVDRSKVVWESSDTTIATVANGVVTALKAGKTTIKAKFGTTIVDECELSCVEVNLGSAESPLTVAEALAAAQTMGLKSGQFSPNKAYVQGTVEYADGVFYNGAYFGKWNAVTGDDKLYVANTKDNAVEAYAGDTVVVSGYLSYDSTLKAFELLKNADNVYPKIEKAVSRGTGTVTIGAHENATVSELSAESGANASTVTFKVAPATGYAIKSVVATSTAGTQTLTEADGIYTAVIKGNITITVEAIDASAKVVSLADLGANLSTTAATTETEFTIGGYTLVYNNGKKQGNAIFLTSGTGYFYNKTAMPGAIKSIKVTTNSGAAAACNYAVAFSATPITAKVAGTNGFVIGAGAEHEYECSVEGALYFCVSVSAKNGQVLSVEISYE